MLVVEDGTGIADADSYSDLTTALAFCADRGIAAWAGLQDSAREVALRNGAIAVDTLYTQPGRRLTKMQGLMWPGEYRDRDGDWTLGLPTEVMQAAILLAVESLSGALAPSATGPAVKRQRTRIEGAIDTETEYAGGGQLEARSFPAVDRLLARIGCAPLCAQGGGMLRAVRG